MIIPCFLSPKSLIKKAHYKEQSIKLLLAIFFIITPLYIHSQTATNKTQYVMVSFDGSKNLTMWKNLLENGDRFNARFTFFVSGVYFLSQENSTQYKPPGMAPGNSSIGFGGTKEDVKKRINYVSQAILKGHEIASHANGHYPGGQTTWKGKTTGYNWSFEMWYDELDSFINFLWKAASNNSIHTSPGELNQWQYLLRNQVRGFRAPNLSVNEGLTEALNRGYLADSHIQIYTYNSSSAQQIVKPTKNSMGVWNFPLGYIDIADSNKKTIAMDYNFYVSDSGAKPDNVNAQSYENRYYKSLKKYFNTSYKKTNAPLFIGNHFSTWNSGAYYKGLMRFIDDVCKLEDVKCITMNEYASTLTENKIPTPPKMGEKNIWATSSIVNLNQNISPQLINKKITPAPQSKEIPINCNSESHTETVDQNSLILNF